MEMHASKEDPRHWPEGREVALKNLGNNKITWRKPLDDGWSGAMNTEAVVEGKTGGGVVKRQENWNILHNQEEHMFFQGYCQWNLISFRTHTQSCWGFSLPPPSTHACQTISLFSAQIPGRYPGDRHQRNWSWQPRTGHAVRGRRGTTWKAREFTGHFIIVIIIIFKELRNVFRLSFSLRTATSGREGVALKSSGPEQHSAAGQQGREMLHPAEKNRGIHAGWGGSSLLPK